MGLLITTARMAMNLLMAISTAKFISNVVLIKGVYIVRFLFSSTLYICVIINIMVVLIAASSIVLCRKTDTQDCNFGDGCDKDTLRPCQEGPLYNVGDHGDSDYSCNDMHDGVGPRRVARAFANGVHIEAREIIKRVYSEEMSSNHWDRKEEEGSTIDERWKAIARGGKNGSAKGREEPGKNEMRVGLVAQASTTMEIFIQSQDITKRAREKTIEYWGHKGEEKKHRKRLRKSKTSLVHMPESSARMEDGKALRKSETFNDKGCITCGEEVERDPSAGLEEFNKKVQAFIDKMNKEIRLQRQESDEVLVGNEQLMTEAL